MFQILFTDVLVIGGGGAGARAAYEAAKKGVKVTLLDKERFSSSGSTAYGVVETAGFNVADGEVDYLDNSEEHYKDIMLAAQGTCSPKLARIVAEEAGQALRDLEELGVNFEKDDNGKYVEVRGCFASKPRMHIIKGHGVPIIKVLERVINKNGIDVMNNLRAVDLIIYENKCYGALCLNKKGEIIIIEAKSTILATGGAGQLFKYTLNPGEITGDGYALGLRAGAEMVNMEFMQAGIGLIYPFQCLISSWLWEGVPRLYNSDNEQFMYRYLPEGFLENDCIREKSRHFPFSCRDKSHYVDISIQSELKRGLKVSIDFSNSYEDICKLPENSDFKKMWSTTSEWMMNKGLNLSKEAGQVVCYGHAINGGLLIDEYGETSINNLFAIGEVAGGPHGADRLGGNMLVTCQVFGVRAGKKAAEISKKTSYLDQVRLESIGKQLLENIGWENGTNDTKDLNELGYSIKELLWRNFLIVKNAASLDRCLNGIKEINEVLSKSNDGLNYNVLDIRNLIDTANVMVYAAAERKESRGSHYREDYPTISDDYDCSLVILKDGEEITLNKRKLV